GQLGRDLPQKHRGLRWRRPERTSGSRAREANCMIEGHDYSIYSNGPGGRSRMYAFLALVTASVTPLAPHGGITILRRYWGDDWDTAQAALFFGGFTALFLYGVLVNVFSAYVWRTRVGAWTFRLIGMAAPPDLNGDYRGTIELYPANDR